MKKYVSVFLVIVSLISCSTDGSGALSNLFMNKRSFEDLVNRFENEERAKIQKPNEVIALLGDIRGKKIMDIGAGTGYFSFRMTAKGASVIGADVDDRFLNYMNEKKQRLNDNLFVTRKVEYDDPLLKETETDHVIIVNTYHHIDDRAIYFAKVLKGIKKGGTLMVVDFKKNSGGEGPPKRYRVAVDKVSKELTEAGFSKITVNNELLDKSYVIIAEK